MSIEPIDKLRAIAKFIRDCEQLHPFDDANCRTFCMLALDQILSQHGFPVPILANPNRFNSYSVEELVSEIIEGMEHTMLVAQGKMDLYGVTTQDILSVTSPEEMEEARLLGIAPPSMKTASASPAGTKDFNFGPPGALQKLGISSVPSPPTNDDATTTLDSKVPRPDD